MSKAPRKKLRTESDIKEYIESYLGVNKDMSITYKDLAMLTREAHLTLKIIKMPELMTHLYKDQTWFRELEA